MPWWEQFFDEHYFDLYDLYLTPERTAREVEGVIQILTLPPGAKVLDLCCGHGRHTIPLARAGYQVTGLDLSEVFLRLARQDAAAAGVAVTWVQRDMRDIPFQDEFDAIVNLFTAFGYFDDEAENQKVLEAVARALKPGGRFLIDTINRDWLAKVFLPRDWERLGEILVWRERSFDPIAGRSTEIMHWEKDGLRHTRSNAVRVYTATELTSMLAAAGLRLVKAYGGLDGSELVFGSRRIALLAEKPATP
jgi:SAM-dependent methyltransferase